MVDLEGTSWQQRYSATAIFTLRCRIPDRPEMLGRVLSAIGKAGGHTGEIKMIDAEKDYIVRDITVYLKDNTHLKGLIGDIEKIEGLDIQKVTDEVLETHRHGSIVLISRSKIKSLTDLRMVYTPGVASVCTEVKKGPDAAWELTGIRNRVAIVTNGTAVLGLGDIGVVPSLPVMEGKASILAEFVDVTGFPILIDTKDIDTFVETVVRIAPGFGAIQLEDVAAPACFEVEEKLKARLNIPVFHDDQHGTATIVLAALINALKMAGKKPQDCSAIMLGAGAAGIAVSKMLLDYGLKDIVVYDSRGAVYRGRKEHMNPYKQRLAEITNRENEKGSLEEGFAGKHIFIGLSRPNMVNKQMIASMADEPIVFPLANPIGEITKQEALEAGAAVTADGRDINNALAYPAIFRAALDARASEINMKMKKAASQKLAQLAPEGSLLPDILDRSVHREVARAVTEAWGR